MKLRPPVLPDAVRELQELIAAGAAVVESGEEPQPEILGLIPRSPKKLTPEERFARLENLLGNCRKLHSQLVVHRSDLLSFYPLILSQARAAATPHDARGLWHTFAVLFSERTAEESREFQEILHSRSNRTNSATMASGFDV